MKGKLMDLNPSFKRALPIIVYILERDIF